MACPPGRTVSERVAGLFVICHELHDRKNKDYGSSDDPLANLRIEGWPGVVTRLQDKLSRLHTAREKTLLGEPMANESVMDTFQDIVTYAAIGAILYEDDELGRWRGFADRIRRTGAE